MEQREGNDPRAGDLHCHEPCYKNKTGTRLLTRKESICQETGQLKKRAYFAKWPGEQVSQLEQCAHYALAKSKRVSMDYADYFFQFYEFLNQQVGGEAPYFIEGVEKITNVSSLDFTITHRKEEDGIPGITHVYIVDENKRKKKSHPKTSVENNTFHIAIRISEFTSEQLTNFEVSGEGKFRVEWDYCVGKTHNQIQSHADDEEYIKSKRDEILDEVLKQMEKKKLIEEQRSEFMNNSLIELPDNIALEDTEYVESFVIDFVELEGYHRLIQLLSPVKINHNGLPVRLDPDGYVTLRYMFKRRNNTIEVRDSAIHPSTLGGFELHFDEFNLKVKTTEKADGLRCVIQFSSEFIGPSTRDLVSKVLLEMWRAGETAQIERLENSLAEEERLLSIVGGANNHNPISILQADEARPKLHDARGATRAAVMRILSDLNMPHAPITGIEIMDLWKSYETKQFDSRTNPT